ncbi:MAG: SpoIIE family protein phosphatase [Acidobacteriota bacterium]|nr:SpoIIE family protein phosphatase [Acidobacteriota bacterium]
MDIILKHISTFPNWHLALDFLKRSQVNYLLAEDYPEIEPPNRLRGQIILRGVSGRGLFVTVPATYSEELVLAVATGLATFRTESDHPRLGSIRSTNFINFLNEFAAILTGKFNLDEVAQAITDKTCALFEADGASILVPTDDENYRFAYITTESDEVRARLEKLVVPANIGVVGWVVKNRKAFLVNDTTRDEVFSDLVDTRAQFKTRDIISAPIDAGDKLIGVLQVLNKRQGKFKQTDLRLIQLIAAIISVFINKAKLYEEQLQYVRMNRELEIAHTLQRHMMPELPSRIGPFLLHGESRQVSQVGGDFWDVLEFGETQRLLILGDVSGHGLAASLLMSSVRTAARALLSTIDSPEELVPLLNKLIHKEFGNKGHYTTMIFCHLDIQRHKILYFRAGHEYPILRNPDGHYKMRRRGGLPLGLFPFRMEDTWFEHDFTTGEALFLYTDGIIDGLPAEEDEELHLDNIMEQHPYLGDKVGQGLFFETLTSRLGWRDLDDATILRLTLA